jgi:hypothetical protein
MTRENGVTLQEKGKYNRRKEECTLSFYLPNAVLYIAVYIFTSFLWLLRLSVCINLLEPNGNFTYQHV